MSELTITRPDDWHIHLRDTTALPLTVKDVSRVFKRAIVMPNLVPPVRTADDATAYKERIDAEIPAGNGFEALMTLYLTDRTSPEDIRAAKASDIVHGVKLYPAGATTNSDAGLTDIHNAQAALETMAEVGMPLLVHGEVTDTAIDIFDREKAFLDRVLLPLRQRIPALRIVLEHITTSDSVDFVQDQDNIGATITAHHLLYNRNHMLVGGIKPHYYCLPILKRNTHQQSLIEAATSGNAKFFLGTDSAPHPTHAKESACGCAGAYTAHAAIELYAEAFDEAGALDKLEGFASFHGPDFYGLPRNSDAITLRKEPWKVPAQYNMGGTPLTPLCANEELNWKVVSGNND